MSDRDKLIAAALRKADFHDRFGEKNETGILFRALVAELVRDTPRVVTTVAELDALPDHSIVMSHGWAAQKMGNWWNTVLADEYPLPATVLFTPTSKDDT